jgi:hypothetical protein
MAGLIVFVAVAVAVWWLLVDRLVERGVEAVGSTLVGAKVELGAADVSLVPLGIELRHLEVANPDEPMRNAVEVARIAFGMEALQLLRRKVIIDEMTADGVRFNTERRPLGRSSNNPIKGRSPKQRPRRSPFPPSICRARATSSGRRTWNHSRRSPPCVPTSIRAASAGSSGYPTCPTRPKWTSTSGGSTV